MTALLEMPAIRDRVARLSVADYHRLGELTVELIRGTIIEKKSKPPLHTFILESLREILTGQIDPAVIVFQESPLTTEDSEPEHDICVVRGPHSPLRSWRMIPAPSKAPRSPACPWTSRRCFGRGGSHYSRSHWRL